MEKAHLAILPRSLTSLCLRGPFNVTAEASASVPSGIQPHTFELAECTQQLKLVFSWYYRVGLMGASYPSCIFARPAHRGSLRPAQGSMARTVPASMGTCGVLILKSGSPGFVPQGANSEARSAIHSSYGNYIDTRKQSSWRLLSQLCPLAVLCAPS